MILRKSANKNMLNKYSFAFLSIFFLILSSSLCEAGLSLQGPSGYINVPSYRTVREKEIELSFRTRMYDSYKGDKTKDGYMTTISFAFSPIKDVEFGIQADLDSETDRNNVETDPKLNFKVRLPSIGEGEFSEIAFGGVFDTNPNNYHTLYITCGGFGLGWNFGGNEGVGTASYGRYKSGSKKPDSLCFMFGAELPGRKPGERGYKSQYVVDYNGDVVSLGWRYYSHRGFSVEIAGSTKTSYDEFYEYKPLIVGFGANF